MPDADDDVSVGVRPAAEERAPLISVLLPTVRPWPEVSCALGVLLAQKAAPTFEVLILDGHGGALEAAPASAAVRWLRLPGFDTFALRAAGLAAARGTIIAVSEDHCIAPPDWLASIAAAHRADPAPALLGMTVNHAESAGSAIDRANFILTFAGQNANRLDVRLRRLPVPTNLSFKREALPAAALAPGELEYQWLAQLNDAGAISVARSVVLHHKQRWGLAAPGVHLASGRSFGASVREAPWRHQLHWWLALPFLPLRLARLVMPDLFAGAAGARVSAADVFCSAALILANLCGQILGAAVGAGTSRRRL
jgi:hypothetical protein